MNITRISRPTNHRCTRRTFIVGALAATCCPAGSGETRHVARFECAGAMVLGRREYTSDALARHSPFDLALLLPSEHVPLQVLRWHQRERQLYWRLPAGTDADAKLVQRHLLNIHVVQPDRAVRKQLEQLTYGHRINLSGSLVDLWVDHEQRWLETSTTVQDHGPGACEIVAIEHLTVVRGAPLEQCRLPADINRTG